MSHPPPIVELRKVSQQFGSFSALENINLKIFPGERIALLGSSGAGKSTLLRILNGTLMPTQGEVWLLGRNLRGLSNHRLRQVQRQIGTVYQQFHLVDNLRVIHNVNAGNLVRWSFWQACVSLIFPLEVEKARKALEKVGIPEKIYTRTDKLSGGQQQRVALARVMVQNPALIIADEPISSLDGELSREIMDLLQDMTINEGKTLITSLHAIKFAFSHTERIIGLNSGKIVIDAPISQISPQMIEELYIRSC